MKSYEKDSIEIEDLVQETTKFPFQSCRSIANLIGLWPIDLKTSSIKGIIKLTLNILCSFLLSFVLVSSILYGSFVLTNWNQRIRLTGPTSFVTMSWTKYILLMCNSKKIEKCVEFVKNDWKKIQDKDQRHLMIKSAKIGHYLTIISAIFMYSGGVWYHIVIPLMADPIVTDVNITIKPYPDPVFGKFFTNGYSPIYEIVFAAHLFTGFVENSTSITTFGLASVFTMHACGQFSVVKLHLNDLINGNRKQESLKNRLIFIITQHLRVLRFISYLEDLLSEICFIEVVGCTLNLCLLGYYTITAWKQDDITTALTCFILLLSFLFNISIYCYIGELLTTQASKIGESAYQIEWYHLPHKMSLDLIFMIRISHFPAKITAGKIIILSMTTFSTVIKSSAAYCNVLWKITE